MQLIFFSLFTHSFHNIKTFSALATGGAVPPALLKPAYMTQIFYPSIIHTLSLLLCFLTQLPVLFIVIPYSLLCGNKRHDLAHDISAAPSGFCCMQHVEHLSAFLLLPERGWIPKHSS